MGKMDFTVGEQTGSVDVAFDTANRNIVFEYQGKEKAVAREIPFDGTVALPQGDRAAFLMSDRRVWETPLLIADADALLKRIARKYPLQNG
jgi:hypothetical protein